VKQRYKVLRRRRGGQSEERDPIWEALWHIKGVLPRVYFFLWRACHGELPTAQELHRRISRIQTLFERCNQENDFLNHLLFYCRGSRFVWFASSLALRIDEIPLGFRQALAHLAVVLSDEDKVKATNLLWCIWKAHNAKLLEEKRMNPMAVVRQAKAMEYEISNNNGELTIGPKPISVKEEGIIIVDGSWEPNHKVGAAMLAYNERNELLVVKQWVFHTISPFIAEAEGLQKAVRWVAIQEGRMGVAAWVLISDCRALVHAVQTKSTQDILIWQAADTVLSIG
jgi:zinc-binding in reverse transcriptase